MEMPTLVDGREIFFMEKESIFSFVVKYMMGTSSMEIKMEEVYIIMITVKLLTMVTGKTIKSMGSVLFPVGNSFMKANGHTIIDLVTVTF
jgi:hypothetical protein